MQKTEPTLPKTFQGMREATNTPDKYIYILKFIEIFKTVVKKLELTFEKAWVKFSENSYIFRKGNVMLNYVDEIDNLLAEFNAIVAETEAFLTSGYEIKDAEKNVIKARNILSNISKKQEKMQNELTKLQTLVSEKEFINFQDIARDSLTHTGETQFAKLSSLKQKVESFANAWGDKRYLSPKEKSFTKSEMQGFLQTQSKKTQSDKK